MPDPAGFVTDRAPTAEEQARCLAWARRCLAGESAVWFMRAKTTLVYMSGVVCPELAEVADRDDVGVMVQPGTRSLIRRCTARWAVDNGAFGNPEFDESAWWAWVESIDQSGCMFVVAPDVPGDHLATLARSRPWLGKICSLGLPAAFAAQDGADAESLPWDEFDVLFVGGLADRWGREWKVGPQARAIVARAGDLGKWVHMGRVNTGRIRTAWWMGCDSVDGTLLRFGPRENIGRLIRLLDGLRAEAGTQRLFDDQRTK
jgi:hypothetical protein